VCSCIILAPTATSISPTKSSTFLLIKSTALLPGIVTHYQDHICSFHGPFIYRKVRLKCSLSQSKMNLVELEEWNSFQEKWLAWSFLLAMRFLPMKVLGIFLKRYRNMSQLGSDIVKKKIKSIMCMYAKRIRGAYSAMLGLIFLCQASSKKGKMKHLAVMEHAAGPVAFNKIGINSLVQRERKNSEHPKIFNLVIFKLTALKICL